MKRYPSPKAQGLYDPQWEHDACGIGAVVNISGRREHAIVEYGKQVLLNLMHRGAAGADEIDRRRGGHPPADSRTSSSPPRPSRLGFDLPEPKQYGVAMLFLPQDERAAATVRGRSSTEAVDAEGLTVLGWRDVPTDNALPGRDRPAAAEPVIRQVFIGGGGLRGRGARAAAVRGPQAGRERRVAETLGDAAERVLRALDVVPHDRLQGHVPGAAVVRLLSRPGRRAGARRRLAIVHQRYSTNTFPSWRLAQPFRMIAHNGEINTLRGNANRLQGCEKTMACAGADRRHVGAVSDPRSRAAATRPASTTRWNCWSAPAARRRTP